jgi:ubiquinone/menaquinone biosynthesis C-methylase UbiE
MISTANDPRFWDRIARKYAADPIADMGGYEKTLERTRSYLGIGDTVLEFGCGTGSTALRLAPHVARMIATDISSEMITIAREKAEALGCSNVDFRPAPLIDGAVAETGLDAVLAYSVLHLVADRRALLARVRSMLKPGGLFISKTPCLSEMNPLIRVALPLMQLIRKAPYVEFFSGEELEADLVASGFSIVEKGRHATKGKDIRVFLVARRAG